MSVTNMLNVREELNKAMDAWDRYFDLCVMHPENDVYEFFERLYLRNVEDIKEFIDKGCRLDKKENKQ
jgi:hypothetical protein